ncbi:FtsX-like permease family protein [Luteimonas sp. 100069]|uniref:ABC transporter permease n=1 Tax=Luteimonas sp. 100069 TaxID=2006109 RepID=UPI000F50DF5F|nr:FtsX-like permease family protein [Luteimonas sp. 100069]RPD84013.1 FtsX-like permease family protein [Luteimonas sp. 100069]
MDIRPILSTLRRHKTAAALIVIEIALACAIICNAIYLIDRRLDHMARPSGTVENEIVRIQMPSIDERDAAHRKAGVERDLAALRAIPGVRHVAAATQIPYGNSSSTTGVRLHPDQVSDTLLASPYLGTEELLDTFGLQLVAGRRFNADEFIDSSDLQGGGDAARTPAAIINRAMAERLFPGENAVGKQIYSMGTAAIPIVGIVDTLAMPTDGTGPGDATMLLPVRNYSNGINYVIRTDPAQRREVLEASVAALSRLDPDRVAVNSDLLSDLRDRYYREDRAMAGLLVVVCIALLVVTALGIVGLASFWVQQRTKQIGIRRALGATRSQILRYFQLENFLLATIGIVLGMLLAYGLNQLLMSRYELGRLPLVYLPAGALALWLLGQIAVYWPARRAASVPPAVATRSI